MNVKDMHPYANLHLHSTHSDGVYSPTELVTISKNEGYKALAITDHDTVSAYPELKIACEKEGMECILGAEFTVIEPTDFHIVGFGFNPEYPDMKDYLEKMAYRQTDNTKKCFDNAVSLGNIVGITWEEVLAYNTDIPWMCNNHVFRAMKAKGLVEESDYMNWFNLNFSKQRGWYPPCYNFLPLEEMISLIKRAGGFAVCAHPSMRHLEKIDMLLSAGIDGLEVLHPDLSYEEKQFSLDLCIKNNLFISGGSDHSGLCGGYYDSFKSEEELRSSILYIEPLTVGVTKEHYEEISTRKLQR